MSDSLLDHYTIPNYRRYEFYPERGEGSYLWDRDGRKYLDFAGGVAVCPLGHCHPEVVSALQQQAAKLIHVSNWYQIPQQGELARTLVEDVLGIPGKCFFGNSGAEANEGLIKVARKYGIAKPAADGTPRHEILTFTGSFHGRTFATMTATAQEKIHGGFGPLVPGFKYLPFNDIAALEAAITPNTVAILFEPVQGESGVHPATPEFLRAAAKLRDKHDLLLLFDEIQCGLGRTGDWCGWKTLAPDIMPDGISWAKGIANGFPLGAFWASANRGLSDLLGPGTHGTTYGGNPVCCAAGVTVLDIIERDNLRANAVRQGERLAGMITGSKVETVRKVGLMIGIQLKEGLTALDAVKALMAEGLLAIPAGERVVRLLPPLNITDGEVDAAAAVLARVLK